MYEVCLESAAENDLKRLPTTTFHRIIPQIRILAENPRPSGCRKLTGSKNDWRIRVGGHHIPETIVRRRFGRSLPNFLRFYKPLADSWTIFDNSGDVPKMIAFEESGKIEILDPDLFEILLKHKVEQ